MVTTNWHNAREYQAKLPHTFIALQHLTMAMADYVKKRGKKSFLGKDKGLAAYKHFEDKLRDAVLAMVLDGVIARNAGAAEARERLVEAIEMFEATFPNWQDAYAFAEEFLVGSSEVAEDRIRSALS